MVLFTIAIRTPSIVLDSATHVYSTILSNRFTVERHNRLTAQNVPCRAAHAGICLKRMTATAALDFYKICVIPLLRAKGRGANDLHLVNWRYIGILYF